MAALPCDSLSAMIPEPTTAASKKAAPSHSANARCGSAAIEFLDDRPPLLRIGFHQRVERFRRLLFPWKNLDTKICETSSHRRFSPRIHLDGGK
jgi:hypothetical protein